MSWVALTYRDYAALPDDGRRYQILDGELYVTPAPSRQHQKVLGNSPSTVETDRHRKPQLYARFGIAWYWIVDPDTRAVEVYRLEGASFALASRRAGSEPFAAEPFADLTLTPDALWA